jgi:hypothetical protein
MEHPEPLEVCGPFKPDERRKLAGLIELIRVALNLLPDAARALEALVLLVGWELPQISALRSEGFFS